MPALSRFSNAIEIYIISFIHSYSGHYSEHRKAAENEGDPGINGNEI